MRSVYSVAFAPDGKTIATHSQDDTLRILNSQMGRTTYPGVLKDTVRLRDVNTGDLIHTFTGYTSSVRSVAFRPDRQTIVSGSEDNTVRLWDANTGNLARTLTEHTDMVNSVAFSPDGKTIVSESNGTIRLWDANTGNLVRTPPGHAYAVSSVAFSPEWKDAR